MKKIFLTLIVVLAYCGSALAQSWVGCNPNGYESYWPDFYDPDYFSQEPFVAAITIDGQLVSLENNADNWSALEVAAFINTSEGEECRGNLIWLTDEYVLEYGDPYLTIDGFAIYYNTPGGGDVFFKMYDHANGILYTECTITYMGEPFSFEPGTEVTQGWDDPENPVMINFTSPAQEGYTLEIDPYEGERDKYYLIASPVGEIDASMVEGLMTPNYDFYAFSQNGTEEAPDKEWINLREQLDNAETVTLLPGAGYLYANSTGTDLTFPAGTPVEGDEYVVDLITEENEGMDFLGWNLVGNPFAVDAYLDQPFYCMVNGAFVDKDAGESLPAMNGAFVVATNDANTVTFSKEAQGKAPRLALNLSSSGRVIDRAIVRFGQGQQLPKFQLFRNSTKVYIPVEGKDYAIVNGSNQGEMPVSFKAETNGTYTLSFNTEAMRMSYLHLIDNRTGDDIDLLATPSYTFDARFTDYANRFKLVYCAGELGDNSDFAFISDGNLIVNGKGTLQVIDVLGHQLFSKELSTANCQLPTANLPAGVYVLQLTNGNDLKTQKIVIE